MAKIARTNLSLETTTTNEKGNNVDFKAENEKKEWKETAADVLVNGGEGREERGGGDGGGGGGGREGGGGDDADDDNVDVASDDVPLNLSTSSSEAGDNNNEDEEEEEDSDCLSGPCYHRPDSFPSPISLVEHAADQSSLARLRQSLTGLLDALLGEERLAEMGYPDRDILQLLRSVLFFFFYIHAEFPDKISIPSWYKKKNHLLT